MEFGIWSVLPVCEDPGFQIYSQVTGDIYTQDTYSDLKEQTAGFYVSLGRKLCIGNFLFHICYGGILYYW